MFHRDKVEVEYGQIYKGVGLGTTVWSPLASGILSGKHRDTKANKGTRLTMEGLDWLRERELTEARLKKVDKLKTLAESIDLSLPVMALAWCLKNPHVSTVILGASKEAQLRENLGAVDAQDKLTPAVMARIEKMLDNAPVRPQF
jgi:aryl-alcohol dehydrogenase-like predicted oxidoreductase